MHRRNTVLLILLATLTCVAAFGQNAAAQKTVSQRTVKLDFAIELSKPQFSVAEPIVVYVTITNRTATPVNVTFWGRRKDQPIVNFHIIASNGNRFLFSTKQNLWCGTGIDNAAILTDREYRFSVDLLKTWEWGGAQAKLPPGTYTISAELFSNTDNGARTKVAESGQATFTVIGDQ